MRNFEEEISAAGSAVAWRTEGLSLNLCAADRMNRLSDLRTAIDELQNVIRDAIEADWHTAAKVTT